MYFKRIILISTILSLLCMLSVFVRSFYVLTLLFLCQIFPANNDSDEEALTIFDLPLFGRYIRIHPLGWINDIALRLEVLGCDTQQGLWGIWPLPLMPCNIYSGFVIAQFFFYIACYRTYSTTKYYCVRKTVLLWLLFLLFSLAAHS